MKIFEYDYLGMSAEMGYWMMLGIFPLLFFIMSLFGFLGKKSLMVHVFAFLSHMLPADAYNLIRDVLNEVMIFKQGKIVAIIGILVTIFLSSNAIYCVIKGLNRAYGINETRSLIYTRILSIVMVFANAFVLFIAMNLVVFGKVILFYLAIVFNISSTVQSLILFLRWPIAFIFLFFVSSINYYVLPAFTFETKKRSVIPGTLFFCIFWLIGSWGFSLYVGNLNTYNRVYGTLGAFTMMMVWLYYTSILILLGGNINSIIYKDDLKLAEENPNKITGGTSKNAD
ncbi:YihY/virulence factor BrkB family protein [bacterium]|nr:YihY/virulence factor BrkB family protein [bacterium]